MEYHFSKGLENLPLAGEIRRKVFIEEQGFSEELEFDETDAAAWHILLTDNGSPVATGRLYQKDNRRPKLYTIGRLAVLPEYRKTGSGRRVLSYLEEEACRLGGTRLILCAQVRAKEFYKRCGYRRTFHSPVDDEGVPHIYMFKRLHTHTVRYRLQKLRLRLPSGNTIFKKNRL